MDSYKSWIIRNNRVMAPVLAIVFSSIVAFGAIYIFGELMFLVPVVTFFTFHYTKLYRFKPRLLGGTVVFFIVAFIATGLLTHALYTSQPTYKTDFTDGTNVTATVVPYSGSSQYYTYTFFITPNGTFDYNSLNLNIQGTGGYLKVVHYSEMTNQTFSGNNTRELTYQLANPGTGVYSYNLSVQKNGTIYTPEISGPLHTSELTVYTYILPTYAIYYLIVYELIFIAGLFIARSIANSKRYSQPPVS